VFAGGTLLLPECAERIKSRGSPPRISEAQMIKLLVLKGSEAVPLVILMRVEELEGQMTLNVASEFEINSGFPPLPASL
jgi:hypothetical protein